MTGGKWLLILAYDFGYVGLGMDNFWYIVAPIAVVFIGLVIGAIAWLRGYQVCYTLKCITVDLFLIYLLSHTDVE